MAITAITGRGGSATVGGHAVAISKWTAKFTKALADTTDSSTWDGTHLFQSQAPGVLGCDGTLEGYWDQAGSTTTYLMNILLNDPKTAVTLAYDSTGSHNAMVGYFDISDVEISLEVPGATAVKFTANFKSNGPFTLT